MSNDGTPTSGGAEVDARRCSSGGMGMDDLGGECARARVWEGAEGVRVSWEWGWEWEW